MSNKLSKYNTENEAFEDELANVEKELSTKKEIISRHRENMVQVDNHINSLTRRLTEMSVEIAPYRVKYSNCVRCIEPLEDSVQRKSKAVEQLEEKLNEERKRVKKLTEQIASMQDIYKPFDAYNIVS
ncbi:Hypothetical predicted protein [Octopus vulgaris]|uniref:Uncharacterized protein n=1 Tax=Octopus vulgaris TaxID=6645 RepID=A0AA36B6J7_OCTVU|nr:Hypothetical predicted protein [Octopus vulgaris]